MEHFKNAKPYYSTGYLDKTLKELGLEPSSSVHDIGKVIFENHYGQKFPSKLPHLLPRTKNPRLLRNPDKFIPKSSIYNDGKIARGSHGYEHVSRVGAEPLVALNMYIAFGNDAVKEQVREIMAKLPEIEGETKKQTYVRFMQTAALYHDAERHGDGRDLPEWEASGAGCCFQLLLKFGCSDDVAFYFANSAAQKDAPLNRNLLVGVLRKKLRLSENDLVEVLNRDDKTEVRVEYFGKDSPVKPSMLKHPELIGKLREELNFCTDYLVEAINEDRNEHLRVEFFGKPDKITTDDIDKYQKGILNSCVMIGDSIDIQRCPTANHWSKNLRSRDALRPMTRRFGVHYSDLWRDASGARGELFISSNNRVALHKEITENALAHRALLQSQGDLKNACPIEVQLADRQTYVISNSVKPSYNLNAKMRYEKGNFKAVEDDYKNKEQNTFISKWYNDGKMLSLDEEHSKSFESAENLSVNNKFIRDFIKPIQEAIDARPQVDKMTLALINLKRELVAKLENHFALKIQNNTLAKDDITSSEFANIPGEIKKLADAIPNEKIDDADAKKDALNAIKGARLALDDVLKNTKCNLAGALAFLLIAAISTVIGATIGAVVGAIAGSWGSAPGAALGGLAGFIVGSAKGYAIGCAAGATILGISAAGGAATLWNAKHAGIRDEVLQVFDAADSVVKQGPVATIAAE